MKYIIYISLSLLLIACQQKSEKQIVLIPAEGNIDEISKNINAGEEVKIKGSIEVKSFDASLAQMMVHRHLNSNAYPIEEDNFSLTIPGSENQVTGEVICRLLYQGQVLDTEKVIISPLDAIDKMDNYNGPKSLFANDDDGSMNVSIPHDKYENPLMSPSKVNYQSSYNGKIETKEEKEIEHLLAYQINPSKQRDGKYLIGASVNEGFSQEQELIIGASMPTAFKIELVEHYPYADARQFMHFKSSVIKDRWKNIVADGTLIIFTIYEEGQVIGNYQAFTIGGIANVYIENPSIETQWKISAGLHDKILSNNIQVAFDKNVSDFPLQWKEEENRLSIGPVVGILGQLAPNGTEVKISSSDHELEDFIYLEDGKVNFTLGIDWLQKAPKNLEILIGGHLKSIELE